MNFNIIEESSDLNFADEFLESLVKLSLITESKSALISSVAMLTESAKKQTDKTKYIIDVLGNTFDVRFADFWAIYNDIKKYPTNKDIMIGIGFKYHTTHPETGKEFTKDMVRNANGQVRHMVKHFAEMYGKQYMLVQPTLRDTLSKIYGFKYLEDVPSTKDASGDMIPDSDAIAGAVAQSQGHHTDEDIDQLFPTDDAPSKEDIAFGTPGQDNSRAGTIAKKINNLEIFNGVIYTNISKIPKQSMFNWLRLWKKDTVGLHDDSSLLGLGRRWKKIFLLGYQVTDRFFYEIWFNTIDSTYTLHDSRGAQLGRRAHSMFEAVRQLFQQLAKSGVSDGEFLRSGLDKSTLDSFVRALTGEVDAHMKDMLDREEREQASVEKKRADEIKRREEFKASVKQKIKDAAKDIKFTAQEMGDNVLMKLAGDPFEDQAEPAMSKEAEAAHRELERQAIERRIQARKESERQQLELQQRQHDLRQQLQQKNQQQGDTFDQMRAAAAKIAQDHAEAGEYDNMSPEFNFGSSHKWHKGYNRYVPVKESFDDGPTERMEEELDMREIVQRRIDSPHYTREIEKLRNDAQKDSANFRMLQNAVMSSVEKYDVTRSDPSIFRHLLSFLDSRKVHLPTDKPSIWNRVKMFFAGTMYRADFISGYTIGNRVNFEIWYVTEPNPEYVEGGHMGKTISSFYLFDVTSGKLLRKYIPYYRNAEQLIVQKVGVGNL
jgi:hypothetical protein